jgi:hypothetical protein
MNACTRSLTTFGLACIAAAAASSAPAQSFSDFVDSRNSVQPYASVLQIEAGAIGSLAEDGDAAALAVGLDDEISWDARVHYRNEGAGSGANTWEAYAGRDGLFASYTDGKLVGDETLTRFEVRARPWQFYRDGYYEDGDLRKNGFYDGEDYEGYVGFGREAQQGLYIELGPFYKTLDFERSELTGDPSVFTIPEGYEAYGGRLYVEQNTVQFDRRRGLARDGYLLTLIGEREWNDSEGAFGRTSLFTTELPSAVWRLRGRVEWYIPSSDAVAWEVFLHGGWHDEQDRVQNAEAQRPLGHHWADAQLRLRMSIGQSMTLTPFVHGQYSKLLEEDGLSSSTDFFFGGGAEAWFHFDQVFSLHGWYSYIDNDNRPSVRIDEDVHGEHMFYLGFVARFGATRR